MNDIFTSQGCQGDSGGFSCWHFDEIEDDGILRNGGFFTDRGYFVPLDNDDDIVAHLRTLAIDQTPGFDGKHLIRRSG